MALLKRALRIAAASAAGVAYVWFAGVRLAPLAKRRRAAKAAARRRSGPVEARNTRVSATPGSDPGVARAGR